MVLALEYLHANDIAHCDLKPDNFLFTTDDEYAHLKIIDFGMSKIVKFRKYFRYGGVSTQSSLLVFFAHCIVLPDFVCKNP